MILFILSIAGLLTWALSAESEGLAYCPDGACRPALETIGLAREVARRAGIRTGYAPNQGTRLARLRAARMAGADECSIAWLDASMSGAVTWADSSGFRRLMPYRAGSPRIYRREDSYLGFGWARG